MKILAEYTVQYEREGSGGRDKIELEEPYSEPNTFNVIDSRRLWSVGGPCGANG